MHNAAFRALGLSAVYVPIRCSARDLPGLMGGLARSGGGGHVPVPHKELAARVVQDAGATQASPLPMHDARERHNLATD